MLLAILIGCGLQKPAPVLLKGEEFYGKRDLEYTREYHLIREPSVQKESRKAIINRIYKDNNNTPVSYTHLDVYKRQLTHFIRRGS